MRRNGRAVSSKKDSQCESLSFWLCAARSTNHAFWRTTTFHSKGIRSLLICKVWVAQVRCFVVAHVLAHNLSTVPAAIETTFSKALPKTAAVSQVNHMRSSCESAKVSDCNIPTQTTSQDMIVVCSHSMHTLWSHLQIAFSRYSSHSRNRGKKLLGVNLDPASGFIYNPCKHCR